MFFNWPFKKRKTTGKVTPPTPWPETPDADPTWDAFRRADGDWCCKVFQRMIKDGVPHITVQTPERDVIVMAIRYCPRCGRKL
ncbi:MAG: hypothetical protein C4560_02985 [Nitrospiraceae bacterium]|nr:MAG: hypothetical protein C4560_02985 [Nitrospiraceae bacterium]